MKRNPVLPYALIGVLGITVMIVMSFVGLNQAEQAGEEGEAKQEQTEGNGEGGGETAGDPEAIYQNNCASCHGGDLSGGFGPALQQVGGSYSADEIANIITNGKGQMPPQNLDESQTQTVAEWLAEKK
ncbi:cytochrome C551 [Pontibacillus halophilus JSM 076056 = DSM 19796]|uniref:Cytochrome C551 n=1 Tax=Pontibacillus halophilus JSM 076056 = DSM 19796 TaxID=1385510 RepID=A0A0A5ICN4_9BACI|nr:cytochrome c [Pontibacillus halophilus]KGX93597.1 cytochrome C551 [Pontibacillus halophilus JSM 076056 = DSM 19796]